MKKTANPSLAVFLFSFYFNSEYPKLLTIASTLLPSWHIGQSAG